MGDNVNTHVGLNFSDLKLLMDTYQNMIQLNTILLEQLKRVIESQQSILKKEEVHSTKQEQIYIKVDELSKNMISCLKCLEEITKDIKVSNDDLQKKVSKEFKDSCDVLTSFKLENIKQNSSIKNRIYIALVGMVAIIISLLGLILK